MSTTKVTQDVLDPTIIQTELGRAADNVFRIVGSTDATKKLGFEVDGFTTGVTRTVTFPDANLTLPAVTAAGDMPLASASGIIDKLPVGAAGSVLLSRAASPLKVAYASVLNKVIYGLTYANNVGDATNDLDIAAGGAMDATGAYFLAGSALTKQSDVLWAVGNAQGALDTGAVGDSDYYIWMIGRSDTGVVDYLFSLSATTPDMTRPTAAYDFKRLIGWFKRAGGTIVAFFTYETEGGGLEFLWASPSLDINLVNTLTTTRRTDAVKVPLAFSVIAKLNVILTRAASSNYAWIYCPDQTDAAPSVTVAPLANHQSTGNQAIGAEMSIRTSQTGLIAARCTVATMDLYAVVTIGFDWARRN